MFLIEKKSVYGDFTHKTVLLISSPISVRVSGKIRNGDFPHNFVLIISSLRAMQVLDKIWRFSAQDCPIHIFTNIGAGFRRNTERRFPAQFRPNHMVPESHVGFGQMWRFPARDYPIDFFTNISADFRQSTAISRTNLSYSYDH